MTKGNRINSVSVVIGLQAGRSGFDSRQGQRFFSSQPRPDRLWGWLNFLYNRYRRLFTRG